LLVCGRFVLACAFASYALCLEILKFLPRKLLSHFSQKTAFIGNSSRLKTALPRRVFCRSFQAAQSAGFWGACQEYILDKKAPDTRFVQCLQGFRVMKKAATMACTNSAFCAKLLQ
jgi:hypothetical protein